MLKAPMGLSVVIAVLVADLVLGVVLGVALGTTIFAPRRILASNPAATPTPIPPTTVTIPQGQDTFEPFILPVKPNTAVTWKNNDTVAHTIVTTPDQNNFLNLQAFSLNVAAGQSVTFTFKTPGLYHYYDNTLST